MVIEIAVERRPETVAGGAGNVIVADCVAA